ncbi:MAG: hypothetical protein QM773_00010 [Hyphomonadaceae bacterium]
MTGGTGTESGVLITYGALGSVTVTGDLVGDGLRSGRVFAGETISNVRLHGMIIGGAGDDSGSLASFSKLGDRDGFQSNYRGSGKNSGTVGSGGVIDNLTVTGAITGGGGENSGAILSGGDNHFVNYSGDHRW